MTWHILRGVVAPGEGWEPFAVEGEVVFWRRAPDGVRGAPVFVDPGEVAAMFHVDRSTVARWVADGLIPRPIKLGQTVRWRLDVLLDALQRGADA